MRETHFPPRFSDLFSFLCRKYSIDQSMVLVEYNSGPPPSLKGGEIGYYDGLLSFRQRNGHPEFLITVFTVSRDPLLTLAHEFAHLVKNLETGEFNKALRPPDDSTEESFDTQARNDITEFERSQTLNSIN